MDAGVPSVLTKESGVFGKLTLSADNLVYANFKRS